MYNLYKINDQLDQDGISINQISDIVVRNQNSKIFKTLDFFVIYISFVASEIEVDGRKYSIPVNHLAYISPHRVIKYSENCCENYVIAFSSIFYEKSVKDSFILNSELFFRISSDIFISPSIGDEFALRNLILKRLELYREKEKNIYLVVAHNCVEILLLDGILGLEITSQIIHGYSTYLDTVNKFRILLQKHFKREKSVAFYSDILCVSPQRLSVMTKSVLGKGAKKMVVEKVTNEALNMIRNTNLNISEISNDLGFVDEANFSTFIKKSTGKSPSEFRFE